MQALEGVATKFVPKGVAKPEDDADYEFDEKFKTVSPRESAIEKVERALGIENLYDPRNAQLVNHLIQALKAESLYQRDVDYVVMDGEVKIVDEFTGRIMEGRRWSEGLHQAVEAKEGVRDQGGARHAGDDHAPELLPALREAGRHDRDREDGGEGVPGDLRPLGRRDPDERPRRAARRERPTSTRRRKPSYDAVIADIKERHELGQPVLVGTISVEVSEHLSKLLERQGIPHNVLNAKQHEREAEVIKDAGERGAVTIATNMAGRGVDIKLGEGVRELGGLYVLGTERHEARRIDNQLRGRSGRQGDPGETRFYLSAQDDLVRLFAGDRIFSIIDRFKLPDDQPMEAGILTKQIEGAQKKVEEQNFVTRKNVLKYDDVMNSQRMVIYEQRRRVLEGEDLSEDIRDWVDEVVERIVLEHTAEDAGRHVGRRRLLGEMGTLYDTEIRPEELDLKSHGAGRPLAEFQEDARDAYEAREEELGAELMREIERYLVLQVVDVRWREHLESMEYLREGIHLRAMAQKDPLVEYRSEGHAMFEELSATIREQVVRYLFHVEVAREEPQHLEPEAHDEQLVYEHESLAGADAIAAAGGAPAATAAPPRPVATRAQTPPEFQGVGRNDLCPCGSGKKFKKCHGA